VYAQNVNADGTLGGTIVATTLALASAEAHADRVTLRWYSARERVNATVYRSNDGTIWSRLATVASDGSGYVVYEDRGVVAGERYAYRLGVFEGPAESFTATTWVEVPSELALALEGPWPQPAGEDLVLRITTPTAGRVRLRFHDLQGRTIATLIDGALEAGQHTRHWRLRDVAGGDLAGGVYFARLELPGRILTRRVVVAH